MTTLQKILASVLAAGFLLLGATVALANPSYFATGVSTNNAASTTPAYMTPGTATSTTPVYDAYANVSASKQFAANSAGLLQRFCASSTATVLNTSIEYSADGIDWYRNFILDPTQDSTTTQTNILALPFSDSQKFASSSLDGAAVAASNNCTTNALTIPTPFRYIRVVDSITGANGSVWNQLVPIKQLQ